LFANAKDALFKVVFGQPGAESIQNVPSPEHWGWKKENSSLHPTWMTLPEAARACSELVKCGCKSKRGCSTWCSCL